MKAAPSSKAHIERATKTRGRILVQQRPSHPDVARAFLRAVSPFVATCLCRQQVERGSIRRRSGGLGPALRRSGSPGRSRFPSRSGARGCVPTSGSRFTGSRYVPARLGYRRMPACQQQHRNNCSGRQELESDHDNTTVAGTTVVFVRLFKFTIVAEPGARPRTSVPTRVARQTTTHWRRPSS